MNGIVIGIDESAGSVAALRWALREAAVQNWPPLTAVLGWGTLDRYCVVLGQRFHRGYDLQDADDALQAIIEKAVGVEPARRFHRRVVCDDGARALLASAGEADLLVVGARGGGGFRDLELGSVAEQCLHHARCPVAVVRRTARTDTGAGTSAPPPSVGRVVVGVDGSEGAQGALRWAIGEAGAHGATLEVLHVWRPVLGVGEPFDSFPTEAAGVEAGQRRARHLVDVAVDWEDTSGLAARPTVTVVLGSPSAVLLAVAERADLVVVGSRGRGGFAGLGLGSVGHQVARHAPCPVVVVPAEGRRDEEEPCRASETPRRSSWTTSGSP
jgi:nucleotide-binding universal stress UspA family protein